MLPGTSTGHFKTLANGRQILQNSTREMPKKRRQLFVSEPRKIQKNFKNFSKKMQKLLKNAPKSFKKHRKCIKNLKKTAKTHKNSVKVLTLFQKNGIF